MSFDKQPIFSSHNITDMNNSSATANLSLDNGTIYFDRWEISSLIQEAIAVPIVFAFIFIVGLVGNGTLIIAVLANKVMRNVPNILIVSLSLGDFLLILVSVPLTSIIYTFANWPFGELMCKVNEYIQTMSLGVSVFTLTALSADRYMAILNPMAKLTGRTQRTTIAVAVAIWIVSALLAIPDLIFGREQYITMENKMNIICSTSPEDMENVYPKFYHIVRFLVFFLLPVVTIGFFYIMMARMLIRSNESVLTESKVGAANHHRQIAARKKVARVVLSFVVIFIFCWLPRYIYILWYHWDNDIYNYFWHVFKITSFCLMFLNSCVNPFALYFLSGQFRKYYNCYLFCFCRHVQYSSLDTTSAMHNLHSSARGASPTNMSLVHSQSVC